MTERPFVLRIRMRRDRIAALPVEPLNPASRTMRFVFPHSHAFPGGRVVVEGDAGTGPECLVEFGDGVTVIAEWRAASDVIHLSVPAYRTAKGTQVVARNWRLVQRKGRVWRSERAP